MPEWVVALLEDVRVSWGEVQAIDFALPTFIGLWCLIVFLPLRGMDRRDPMSGAVYTMFCMGAGVCLMFALSKEYVANPTFGVQLISVSLMGLVAAVRWGYGSNNVLSQEETPSPETKHNTPKKGKGAEDGKI